MKATCQIYVKGSLEAAELYKEAFGLTPDPEMTGYNADGTYEHISLMSGENDFIAIAEGRPYDLFHDETDKRPVMSFNAWELGTKEAVDHAYKVLSAEARINENPSGPCAPFWNKEGDVYAFGLMDKFGVHWGVLM